MKTSRSPWTVVTIALASALLVAGCGAGPGSGAADAGSARKNASSDPPSAASPTRTPMDPVAVVTSIEIQPADLPAGYGPNVMQKGDEVDGQVTLDMCGASFPSEDLRTARHQVAYRFGDPESPGYDATGDRASVMSEAVAYSPGGAEQALHEVRAAIASCPREFAEGGVAGAPPAWTTWTPIPRAPDWQDDHVAVVAEIRVESGVSFRMALIYQRRGDLLAMAYVMTTKHGRGVALARKMASELSNRLDSVPDPTGSDPNA